MPSEIHPQLRRSAMFFARRPARARKFEQTQLTIASESLREFGNLVQGVYEMLSNILLRRRSRLHLHETLTNRTVLVIPQPRVNTVHMERMEAEQCSHHLPLRLGFQTDTAILLL